MVDAFLHENPSARITDFEFSARAPIFANESVYVCGRTAGRGVTELAVIAPDGQAAVTARIKIHTNRE
jgi:hydroxyacyl-ACP dehydratase HTD2-like protein with hotdog domain